MKTATEIPAIPGRKFEPGMVTATPAVIASFPLDFAAECAIAHLRGDWGNVPREDAAENERALTAGLRIMSSWTHPDAGTLWIITEADRSVTTLLTPEEY